MNNKINIACGESKLDGFVNVDFRIEVKPDVVADIRHLPFKDRTIDYVNARHIIEHISHREVNEALGHWVGLLKDGGEIFIGCPDMEGIIKDFGNMDFDEWVKLVFGDQDYAGNYHFGGFTEQVLTEKLVDLGMVIRDYFAANYGINCWAVKEL